MCFQSCLAKFEAEFGANPLLLHISHFTRSVGSQNSTTITSQKCTEKHTRPHNRMLLGRAVHKGYRLRYLAHTSTTSGFHAAFLFRGLLGSITYMAAECHSAVIWIKVVHTNTMNRNPRKFIWIDMCRHPNWAVLTVCVCICVTYHLILLCRKRNIAREYTVPNICDLFLYLQGVGEHACNAHSDWTQWGWQCSFNCIILHADFWQPCWCWSWSLIFWQICGWTSCCFRWWRIAT